MTSSLYIAPRVKREQVLKHQKQFHSSLQLEIVSKRTHFVSISRILRDYLRLVHLHHLAHPVTAKSPKTAKTCGLLEHVPLRYTNTLVVLRQQHIW